MGSPGILLTLRCMAFLSRLLLLISDPAELSSLYQPLALEHLHRVQQVIRNLSTFLKPFNILKVEHFVASLSVDIGHNPIFERRVNRRVVSSKNYLA